MSSYIDKRKILRKPTWNDTVKKHDENDTSVHVKWLTSILRRVYVTLRKSHVKCGWVPLKNAKVAKDDTRQPPMCQKLTPKHVRSSLPFDRTTRILCWWTSSEIKAREFPKMAKLGTTRSLLPDTIKRLWALILKEARFPYKSIAGGLDHSVPLFRRQSWNDHMPRPSTSTYVKFYVSRRKTTTSKTRQKWHVSSRKMAYVDFT